MSASRTCGACGNDLAPGSRFCNQCGVPIGGDAGGLPRFASPQAYTPRHLAEKIFTSKSALEGERKQVTVLFADLKGSLELLAGRDPEEAQSILDPVLELMMQAVHRYEGTVNQVMGDGIMALFGAPVAHEDHAVRACYAALRMQESVKKYAEEVRRAHAAMPMIRVGLNSGEVVVRAIGSDLRMDYTAVGQTTHLAARMEQVAVPGAILIAADTLRLVEGYVRTKPIGPVNVKGIREPVEAYEVTGAESVRTRLDAAAGRGLSRFVGRDNEIDQLSSFLTRAGEGHGQLVAVAGEPGVGKSRLFWEFVHSDATQDWLVVESGSVSYGKATAYLPIVNLVRRYFRIQDHDDHSVILDKVNDRLLALGESLLAARLPLLALLDVPVADEEWQAHDPVQRRRRIQESFKRLFLRESQIQPVVLVFEDLHWMDSESHAVLDTLVEGFSNARLLILVNFRPDYQYAHGRSSRSHQLRIDPLPPERAEELLEALLGSDPSLERLKRLLIQRTEGNPFFLEESARTLIETKVLAGERGAYRLVKPVSTVEAPVSVQTILAARIDRLEPEDKQLLQAAAVVGKDVPFALLLAVTGTEEDSLRRGLSHLQAAELLYETSIFPDLQYTFTHALTHEVAYSSLLHEPRRVLHGRITSAMEKLYRDRLSEHVERLAHHAMAAESWERALRYLRQAGARTLQRSAHREAVAHFRRALDVLMKLPESPERAALAIDLRFDLRSALLPLGELQSILEYLREAEALATALGDHQRLGQLAVYMTGHFYLMGEHTRALESGQRAVAIAEALEDFGLRVATNAYVGQIYYVLGDYGRASEFFRRNVENLVGKAARERFGLPQLPSIHSRTCLVWALAECGDFAEGVRVSDHALAIADSMADPLNTVVACSGLGVLRWRRGEWAEAISVLERAMRLIRDANIALWLPRVGSSLGSVYAAIGRVDEALALLREAVDQSTAMHLVSGRSMLLVALGEASLLAGCPTEADELGTRALALAQAHGERGHEAWALRLRGETALRHHRDAEGAGKLLREALAMADGLGMRPLAAQTRVALATVEARLGRRPVAATHLATAAAEFKAMAMDSWLARAEAEAAVSG
jgi:class 3 adenylate cyclase/tetratricopeptide (TPR) repeat protein